MRWFRRVLLGLILVPFALQVLGKPFLDGTSRTPWLALPVGLLAGAVAAGLVGALSGWHRVARSPKDAWPLVRPALAVAQFFAAGITLGFVVTVWDDSFRDTGVFVMLYALTFAAVLALVWFAEDVVVWNSTRRVR